MENNAVIDWVIPFVVATMMCGIGMNLSMMDFKRVLHHPKAFTIGLILQLVVLPLVGFVLANSFQLEPQLAVGVIILCACPGGPISNLFSFLAKADTALSVMLTTLGTLAAIITIPLVVNLGLDYYLGSQSPLRLPVWDTVFRLMVFVLLPIAIGMMIRHRYPLWAQNNQVNVERGATLLMLVLVAGLVINERDRALILLEQAGLISISLYGIMIFLGVGVGRLFSLRERACRTLAIEVAIQNIPLAFFIANTLLNTPIMAIPGAVYAMVNLILTFALVNLWRRLPVVD